MSPNESIVEDERVSSEPLGFRFRGKLTEVQQQAASALLDHDIGVFVAPPGVGKTVVSTYLVAERAEPITIHHECVFAKARFSTAGDEDSISAPKVIV
jgi:superfamily II DNA or RNA helicase